MKLRTIDDMQVSALGYGAMGLSHAYGEPVERNDAERIIRSAYEAGYTYFDTAEVYRGTYKDGSESNNEELVGRALHDVRDKVRISTKFGISIAADRGLVPDSRPEVIRRSVEASLKRLNTDYIDLYYQHRSDPATEPETVAEVMSQLIREGKILHWGLSECSAQYIERADAVCHVSAIQNRYSMMARSAEALFPLLEKRHIALVAFSPLANGFLTSGAHSFSGSGGKDYRDTMPQFTEEGRERGQALLDLIERLAAEKNCTSAAISLAWMLNNKDYIIPIPGSKNVNRIRENAAAADIVLSADELEQIDSLLEKSDFLVFCGNRIVR